MINLQQPLFKNLHLYFVGCNSNSFFFFLKFHGLDLQAVPCDFEVKGNAPVAVLFSGGLDSMILAAILNECLDTKCNWFFSVFSILGMEVIYLFPFILFFYCFC